MGLDKAGSAWYQRLIDLFLLNVYVEAMVQITEYVAFYIRISLQSLCLLSGFQDSLLYKLIKVSSNAWAPLQANLFLVCHFSQSNDARA